MTEILRKEVEKLNIFGDIEKKETILSNYVKARIGEHMEGAGVQVLITSLESSKMKEGITFLVNENYEKRDSLFVESLDSVIDTIIASLDQHIEANRYNGLTINANLRLSKHDNDVYCRVSINSGEWFPLIRTSDEGVLSGK